MRAWRNVALVMLGTAWLYAVLAAWTRPEPATWYTYHMSFHEAWYPAVLRGDVHDRWMPPGYVFIASGMWFAATVVVKLRLISLAASLFLVDTVYRYVSQRHAALVASGPLLIVFGARAQPDAAMLALCIGGLIVSHRGRPFLGGLLIGLSAFVKPVGLLALFGTRLSKRLMLGLVIGLIPFLVWLAANPTALVLHAGKSLPFQDLPRLLIVTCLALLPTVALLPSGSRRLWRFTLAALLFAFVKAPIAHEYYLLPASIGLQLLSDVRRPGYWILVYANAALGLLATIILGVTAW